MAFNDFDDVKLGLVKDLNTKILNKSFHALVDNDEYVRPKNDYVPNVWERKWYNDESKTGYSKGDCVWKYFTTTEDFLKQYGPLTYEYAVEKEPIRVLPLSDHVDYAGDDRDLYVNIISGYRVDGVQLYPSLFDFGFQDSPANDVSVFISTKDDNKDPVSVVSSWNPIAVKDQNSYAEFISSALCVMLDEHLEKYHLGGLTSTFDVDQMLMRKDFSNFEESRVYNVPKIKDVEKYFSGDGFTYVVKSAKQPVATKSGNRQLYRGFRLWSSGMLEHYGVVEVPTIDEKESDQISDYYFKIDLGWKYEDGERGSSTAETYSYPTVSCFYEDGFQSLYFADGKTEYVTEPLAELRPDCRYQVHLTPIQFDFAEDLSAGKIKEFEQLSVRSYPEDVISGNKTSSYFNDEICHLKNDSFCVTRNETYCLSSSERAQFLGYYVVGYANQNAYDLGSARIKNLKRVYFKNESERVEPEIEIEDFYGKTLRENVDYELRYENNAGPGTATLSVLPKASYFGSVAKNFDISSDNFDHYCINAAKTLSGAVGSDVKYNSGKIVFYPRTFSVWAKWEGDPLPISSSVEQTLFYDSGFGFGFHRQDQSSSAGLKLFVLHELVAWNYSTTVVTKDGWHHYAVVNNEDGSFTVYQDGEKIDFKRSDGAAPSKVSSVKQDARMTDGYRFLYLANQARSRRSRSKITRFVMWNRALTAEEVKKDHDRGMYSVPAFYDDVEHYFNMNPSNSTETQTADLAGHWILTVSGAEYIELSKIQ